VSYFRQSLLSLNLATISTSSRTVVFSSLRERLICVRQSFSLAPDR
jgi:hypothetical protein